MARLLEDRMNRSYEALAGNQRLDVDTSLLKSYVLEASAAPDGMDPSQHASALLQEGSRSLGRRGHAEVDRSQDDSLLILRASAMGDRLELYVDISDSRFWIVHTMGGSGAADWLIDRFAWNVPSLDRAWLPADLLELVSALGSFRGLGLDYDRRLIPDVDFQAAHAPVEFLKMQLWGNRAEDVLRVLRDNNAFPHQTTLAKVRVKFWLDPTDPHSNEFTLDDVKYDGKITARGTSFQSHTSLMSEVIGSYSSAIQRIENDYILRLDGDNDRYRLTGEPVTFIFDPPIADMNVFVKSLLSGGAPFRLWGVPISKNGLVTVQAVDLHVGKTIGLELTRDFMRVFLRDGGCGNSVMRLYTNMQHHYDSLILGVNGQGQDVFGFRATTI